MREILEGSGLLEPWDNPAGQKRSVRYRFEITTEIVDRPGFGGVASDRRSIGTVTSTDGQILPAGDYRLEGEGEILKVRNNGLGMWTILAAP